MAFPVDLLDKYSHEDLESSGEDYLSELRCGDPENPEYLSLVPICLSTVGFIPLYGGEERHKVLALFAPEDSLAAVALFLADQWWTIDDILRTSSPSREGLLRAKSIGERVVLYVLNRIIYRKQEIEKNEIPFLCHGSHDYAKILWKKGMAIGFYSIKLPGSICSAFLTQSYQLPVLDTMFVRKKHQSKDFGLLMLEDFVDSFTEDALGLRFPLTSFMRTACQKYFERYPGDRDLLWEVEGIGHWHQRTPIATVLQRESLKLKGRRPILGVFPPAPAQPKCSPYRELQAREIPTFHPLLVVFPSPELTALPIPTRSRSNHLKRPKLGKRIQEPGISETEDVNTSQTLGNRYKNNYSILQCECPVVSEFFWLILYGCITSMCSCDFFFKETDMEPINGEIMENAIKVSIMTEGSTANEVLDGESKLQSDSSEETTLTLLVPLILDSSGKSTEDSDDNISDKLPAEEEQVTQRKRGNADPVSGTEKEYSNNGLSNSVAGEAPEDAISENVSPNTSSSLEEQSEEGGSDSPEAPITLGQGALMMVELEDISYQQHSEGQKNQMDEQSEESAEPVSERAADSSSEEAEIEVPVVDRRTLRRKAKGYKGPPKKKGKLI
uniref:Family with sequence similarity 169 member A n=1 Tax=Naja naja TaxID=35670 RepID=A0A8C6X5S0_NAJNA